MKSGEANIEMREAQLKNPTKICLEAKSNTLKLNMIKMANETNTADRKPSIFICDTTNKQGKQSANIPIN